MRVRLNLLYAQLFSCPRLLTSLFLSRFIRLMRRRVHTAALILLLALLFPTGVGAVETAPRISDREIIERLTKLEEGQQHLEESLGAKIQANTKAIAELRTDMQTQIQRLRTDMQTQIQQLRQDINAQFDRLFQLMLGILGAFAAIVAATIGFALWDRRTMVRPFESKVKTIEEELTQNRENLHSLLEALRSLGQSDEKVAEVLRQFRLL